jgi:urease accessory protein
LEDTNFPTVYLKSPSSGLLGGDEHQLHVDIGANSKLELRTQAATLVYPGLSLLNIHIKIEDGGKLGFQPHAIILGAAAHLRQRVRIEITGDASLIYSDTWCAGRIAMNERWQFESYDYELEIFQNEKISYREKWCISPGIEQLDSPFMCGQYTHFYSLYDFGGTASDSGSLAACVSPTNMQTFAENEWEISETWTMNRAGNQITRRCSKVKLD